MRLLVLFDLPTKTKDEKADYRHFRDFLLADGYYMLQYSVYVRVVNSWDSLQIFCNRLEQNKPSFGAIRAISVTERQYEKMRLILGERKVQETKIGSQMTLEF